MGILSQTDELTDIASPNNCIDECRVNPACEYWTFFWDINYCVLFDLPSGFHHEAMNATSGVRDCPDDPQDPFCDRQYVINLSH